MRKLIFGTLVAVVVVGATLLVERSVRLDRPIVRGEGSGEVLREDTKLQVFATKEVIPFSRLKGKVFLVNFWASWCRACITEMPGIMRLYDTLKPDGFEIVSVNVDEAPEKAVPRLIEKLHLNFPVYLDVEENLAHQLDVVALPFSAVVDAKGRVIWAESGERDWSSKRVVGEIRGLLEGT